MAASENILYELTVGARASSSLLYTIEEEQLYKVKYKNKDMLHYVCYNNNCKAKIVVNTISNICNRNNNWIEHNHSSQKNIRDGFVAANEIKKKCKSTNHDNESIRNIFHEELDQSK